MMDERQNAFYDPASLMGSIGRTGVPEGYPSSGVDVKSCCAALYSSDTVRLLFGDTLHPGGLALTHRLAELAGLRRDYLLLDVACGRGASALALARASHCRVVGVDLGREGLAEATRLARKGDIDGSVSFLCGDAEMMPLAPESFDVALCECTMSLFPDKARSVAEIARLLRGGGRLGVSDVTVVPGCLPDELKGPLGQMLCLADAPSIEGYRELLSGNGLKLVHQQDASDSILRLTDDIAGKLAAFGLIQAVQRRPQDGRDPVSQALPIIEKVKALVKEGGIGYWLFVAEKTAAL